MNEKTDYATLDKPWLKYYPNYPENIEEKISMSLYQFLEQSVENIPNLPAIEYFGIKISFKEYLKRINDYAKSFKEMGIKKGEIVPLVLPNQPECRMMIYALNILGAISYPIAPSLPTNQLERIINENEIKNLVMFNGFYDKFQEQMNNNYLKNIISLNGKESIPNSLQFLNYFKQILNKTYVKEELPKNSKIIPFKEFSLYKKNIKGNIEPYYEPNYIASIIGTSGTTGIPKGVCLTNENLNTMAIQHMLGNMNINQNDVLLDILIQSIGYGIAVMHYSACCGIKSILIPQLVTDVAPLFLKYKPNHFTGGPVHAESLENYIRNANSEELKKIKEVLNNVKNWVSGGASLSPRTEDYLEKFGITIRQGLGCTENGGAATYTKHGTYKPRTVGIPLMYTTIGIFKPGTDEELKIGETGEICITGPTVMKGYLNNESETNNVLKQHNDGKTWIHTQDLGYMDSDGNVYILDRIKNIFMRTGFKIYPAIVNNFIQSLPNIEESYVMGIEHPKEQIVSVAFISVKNENIIGEIKETLNIECPKNLDESSTPYQYVFIIGKLPRNLGGKIDRKQLLDMSGINYFENDINTDIIISNKPKIIKR